MTAVLDLPRPIGWCTELAHLRANRKQARAYAVGKNGEYHFNCPLDRHFFEFMGIDHEAFLAEVKAGKTAAQALDWVPAHSTRQKSEIFAWSARLEQNGPGGEEVHECFAEVLRTNHSAREDILISHLSGSIAATVNKPSAGSVARWPTNLKMCLKLQNRSGSSG